ncbi:MAG: hypothetical protein IJL17_06685 [Kiritimatiellae bacterium]|nr:hypothetical protein [Kiritimatiellia bacterium]
MNTSKDPIAGTPPAPAKRKVSYGKLSPEAKAALGRMSAESKEMLTAGLEADSKMEKRTTNYRMPKVLTLLWWLWNIGLTIQMVNWYVRLSDGQIHRVAAQQLFGVSDDMVWIVPATTWLVNLVLARLVYEFVSAVFEILYRLRAQDGDMRSIKQAVESLQQRQEVNAPKE